jgi:hypothetical protein
MLLILFLIRSLKQGKFTLATELFEAGKFDDLVLEYTQEGGKNSQFRFLQAKHKLKETRKKTKISFSDLTTGSAKGEFGLQKYFKSFQMIKENPKYQGRIRDLIICTNIDFDSLEDFKGNGVTLHSITEPDEMLSFDYDTKGMCLMQY